MSYDPTGLPGWDIENGGTMGVGGQDATTQAVAAVSPPPPDTRRPSRVVWVNGVPRVMRDNVRENVDSQGFSTGWQEQITDGYGEQFWNSIEDPYRDATTEDLAAEGYFKNIGDVNSSPLWQGFLNNPVMGENAARAREAYANDPNLWARQTLGMAGLDIYDDADTFGAVFGDSELSEDQISQLLGTLEARKQSAMDKDWEDYAEMGMDLALEAAVAGGLGAGFGALGASLAGPAYGGSTAAGGVGNAIGKSLVPFLSGGGVEGMLKSLATSGGGEFFDMLGSTPDSGERLTEFDALDAQDMDATSPLFAQGDTFRSAFEASPSWLKSGPRLSGPASLVQSDGSSVYVDSPEAAGAAGATWSPSSTNPIISPTTFDALDVLDQQDADAAPAPAPAEEPLVTTQTAQKYAKVAKAVYDLVGDAEGAPQPPAEGAGEEERNAYSQQLVDYLGLDSAAMAEAGLEVGTPEYMNYILEQADAVIAQVLGGMNVDAEDLAQQLRSKTDAELQQLQRALYVRGQLEQSMGTGEYTDPFGGGTELVEGEGFNPHVGAYQRGMARSIDQLAGMRGNEAFQHLQGMLGREVDLFGMQEAADQRFEQAKLEDDERRRRGMIY